MSLVYGVKEIMHRIRVKLYPNYLPHGGAWLTRTDSEAVLTVEQVCAALRNRGGFTGNVKDLEKHIEQYFDEAAYQLCDGYTVSNKYYAVYPNLGGTLNTPHDTPTHEKNPLTFRFRTLSALRSLAESIAIHVEGIAETDGYIDEFICTEGKIEHTNTLYSPGKLFTIYGHKIKVEGDEAVTGVFLVDADDPSKSVKMDYINQNDPSAIRGLIPDTGDLGNCRLEIRTHYSGTKTLLKNLRIITSLFILEKG